MTKYLMLFFTVCLILTHSLDGSTIFTFTNCGKTGRTGPSQSQINDAYSGTTLESQVTGSGGIQYWTAPSTCSYRITTYGAEGGSSIGGLGASMSGTFDITAGTQLKILVGQRGGNEPASGDIDHRGHGGGGGTFVTYNDNSPLIIAGGGGGGKPGGNVETGKGGSKELSGSAGNGEGAGSGGTDGNGGENGSGGGGGGLLGNGSWSNRSRAGKYGYAFINGGHGAAASDPYSTFWNGTMGGFGGGGGGAIDDSRGGGGGGGYSGGGGGGHPTIDINHERFQGGGGGGGSYNAGTDQNNTAGVREGHGMVQIECFGPLPPDVGEASAIDMNSFTANWNSVTEATSYRLDVSSNSDFSSFVTGYEDLDVGNTTLENITGLSAGTQYYYRVRAVNSEGTSGSSETQTVTTSGPPPPEANFEADVTAGYSPLEVHFTDLSTTTSSISTWEWDFDNDGTTDSYAQNPSYTFPESGSYSVSLTVTDEYDQSDAETKISYIMVVDEGNYSLDFDGSNDYVEISNNSVLNPTEAITVSAWVLFESTNNTFRYVSKYGSTTGYLLQWYEPSNTLQGGVFGVNSSWTWGAYNWTPETGVWYHTSFTYNKSQIKLYLNGDLVATTDFTEDMNPCSGPLTIGSHEGTECHNGKIDEVNIWNRALTQQEIQSIMSSDPDGSESGLVGCWKFDHGFGDTAYDSTSNENNGTIYGALWSSDVHPLVPTVTTTAASAVTGNGATSGGNVTDNGGASVTARGVCWNTSGSPTTADNHTTDGSGTGSFTSSLSGLSSGTTYYARAWATNVVGTSYGAEITFTTTGQPTFNNALSFDGTDDHVVVGDHSPLFPTNAITISVWAKADEIERGSSSNVLRSASDGYEIQERNDGYWRWYVYFDGLSWEYVRADDEKIVPGTWYHIAGTYDSATGKQRIYINGVLKKEADRGGSLIDYSGKNFVIGAHATLSERYFKGSIDELRVWNVAKTAEAIRENMFKSLDGDEANLVAYYRFNQSSGTTLPDFTSNGLDGALTNMDDTNWEDSETFTTWIGDASSEWSNADNWTDGVPTATDNVGLYKWTDANEVAISGSPEMNHLLISSTATPTVSSGLTVNGNLIVNGTLNLNGQDLTIGASGSLVEESGTVECSGDGELRATQSLSNIINENIMNLGAELTYDGDLGATTINRGYAAQSCNSATSINRYFDISPTTQPASGATLVLHYRDAELNGNIEADLLGWRSTDGGTSWSGVSGTLNTENNTYEMTGITEFSRWTLGDESPVAVAMASFTAVAEGTSINLSWTTESEINVAGFYVLRSKQEHDGYEQITETIIKNKGRGTNGCVYDFVDSPSEPGTYFYKLKVINLDGTDELKGPVSAELLTAVRTHVIPETFALHENYPNPFNPTTTLRYDLPQDAHVTCVVYNVQGQKMATLIDSHKPAGEHSLVWNAGTNFSSGLYFIVMRAGEHVFKQKVSLVK